VAAWGVNIYGMKWRCNDTLAAELRRRGREAEAEEWRCDDPASALLWEFKSQLEGAAGWHVMVAAAGNDGRRLLADCPGYAWMPSQMRASNMLVVTASGEPQVALPAALGRCSLVCGIGIWGGGPALRCRSGSRGSAPRHGHSILGLPGLHAVAATSA
jgi:hypothetical protein